MANKKYGILTKQYYGEELTLKVILSGKGYYIGTLRYRGPSVRESVEYYQARRDAEYDLQNDEFTQRASLDNDDSVYIPVREPKK